MTREVKVYNQRFKLFRVRRCATAWCGARNLAHQIRERGEKSLRVLRLNTNEVKAIVKL